MKGLWCVLCLVWLKYYVKINDRFEPKRPFWLKCPILNEPFWNWMTRLNVNDLFWIWTFRFLFWIRVLIWKECEYEWDVKMWLWLLICYESDATNFVYDLEMNLESAWITSHFTLFGVDLDHQSLQSVRNKLGSVWITNHPIWLGVSLDHQLLHLLRSRRMDHQPLHWLWTRDWLGSPATLLGLDSEHRPSHSMNCYVKCSASGYKCLWFGMCYLFNMLEYFERLCILKLFWLKDIYILL